MAPDLSRARIAVLGCGAVGRSFARGLLDLAPERFGGTLVLWSRRPTSVAATLRGLAPRKRRRVVVARTPEEAAEGARVALLCVSEAGFGPLAQALARAAPPGRAARAWLVSSGSMALEGFAAARARRGTGIGMGIGRLHPLAPFPKGEARSLVGVPFGLEGDARALAVARVLAAWFGGPVLVLTGRPGAAQRYHAGAALLGGGLVALLEMAEEALVPAVRAGRGDVRKALHAFTQAVAREVSARGPARALTGPVARGAETTVRRHLAVLRAVPDAAEAYRVLGRTMLALALTRGTLDALAEKRLRALLGSRTRR